MNEFLEQFLVESREQVEQATADLLALEKAPDKGGLDSAFRAFHTLKGGAGIVDFTSMAQAVHAAEDVLSEARTGAREISTPLISDCLNCLDQVAQWLDTLEATGDLPKHADAQADVIVARFARFGSTSTPPNAGPAPEHWVQALLAKHASLREKATTAIRYAPDCLCFYDGVDPLGRIAAVPGLLSIDVEPASPWPPLDELDPFVCNIVVTVLAQSSRIEAITALGAAADECDVLAVINQRASDPARLMPPQAREVIQAQLLLLDSVGVSEKTGRMASAAVVAENVLRSVGRNTDADDMARTGQTALARNEPRLLREVLEQLLQGRPAEIAAVPSAPTNQEGSQRTLRIDAARVDALVSLTGELSVSKNSIGHVAKLAQEGGHGLAALLKDSYAVLDRLVGELQQTVLSLRVLPLRRVFQRFPRLLREMSGKLGKPANLVIEGGETGADKALVEMLFEPLLHVLRNAMDHGIEDASTRTARGKPEVAIIHLRADRRGDHVVVEVSDDGAGIDVAKIRQVALERNLISGEMIAALSDEAAINMIFDPGFSTAKEVTGLSGRGVGMDAVRTAVGRLGGQVSVESRAGHGTTIRFTLPFSVMMTRVMEVGAGGQLFGIPLDAVVETLRIDADRIVPIGGAHAMVWRNRTIPVVALAGALGLPEEGRQEAQAIIVVTKIDGSHGALRVQRIGQRMELMLKPLDGLLAGVPGLAGSTLLGNGSVLLVLDLGVLFQ